MLLAILLNFQEVWEQLVLHILTQLGIVIVQHYHKEIGHDVQDLFQPEWIKIVC